MRVLLKYLVNQRGSSNIFCTQEKDQISVNLSFFLAHKNTPMAMASMKLLSSSPLHSPSPSCKIKATKDCTQLQLQLQQQKPWIVPIQGMRPTKRLVCVKLSNLLQEPLLAEAATDVATAVTESSTGYSLASYYTSLGLFVLSVPGLWSLIKRSVKSKIVKKSFVGEGEAKMKGPNQVAGEILSFFTRNNFAVSDRGETITFEGEMVPSSSQAALLTFCTFISLLSVGLVLTITVPDVGDKWYYLTVLSPLAGAYYWKKASRKEQIQVKMMVAEDGTLSEIVVQGDDQQVEQLRKELKLSEKGMVYVKGLFER